MELCTLLTLFLFICSVFPVFVRFVVILAGMTGTVGKTLIPWGTTNTLWGYYKYPVRVLQVPREGTTSIPPG